MMMKKHYMDVVTAANSACIGLLQGESLLQDMKGKGWLDRRRGHG